MKCVLVTWLAVKRHVIYQSVSEVRYDQFTLILNEHDRKGLSVSQKQLYDKTTRPLIGDVLQGFNATVFAYGPTGNVD